MNLLFWSSPADIDHFEIIVADQELMIIPLNFHDSYDNDGPVFSLLESHFDRKLHELTRNGSDQ